MLILRQVYAVATERTVLMLPNLTSLRFRPEDY